MTLAIIFDSVGVGEWFVLLAVILIVVGPKRLPSTARKFGAYYSKFRRAAESFKRQLLDMDSEFTDTVREAADEVKNAVNDMNAEFTAPVDAPLSSSDADEKSASAVCDAAPAPTEQDAAPAPTTADVPQDQQS